VFFFNSIIIRSLGCSLDVVIDTCIVYQEKLFVYIFAAWRMLTRETNVDAIIIIRKREVSMWYPLRLEKRNNNNQSSLFMITNSHHSLSALFKPITTAWSCVSKLNLITAIHTYISIYIHTHTHTHISSRSVSHHLPLFFLEDHQPLNRPVIGETLAH